MGIYTINGNSLSNVHDVHGDLSEKAYAIDGTQVYSRHQSVDYDDYTYEHMYNVSGITAHTQSMDIYNGMIAAFRADDLMYTFNLSDGSAIGSAIPTTSAHGGSATFSSEFYTDSDPFPLLYVSSDLTPAEIYVNRITATSSTLIRTLLLPLENAGYYAKATVNGSILYVIGYKENSYTSDGNGTNNIIVSKWNLADLTNNGDGTYTPEFISSYERPFIYVAQFVTYHDGMLWIGSGYGSPSASHVYAMNIDNGTILHDIVLADTVEIEGGAFIENANNTYDLVVLQWGGVFGKYVFGSL